MTAQPTVVSLPELRSQKLTTGSSPWTSRFDELDRLGELTRSWSSFSRMSFSMLLLSTGTHI